MLTDKYICLKIDYRDATIVWWDWNDKEDKEETIFNLFTGERALYTFYKIKKTFFDIYKTLITDIHANKYVLYNIKDKNTVTYGDKTVFLMDEKEIRIRNLFDRTAWDIYKQNMETGEIEKYE